MNPRLTLLLILSIPLSFFAIALLTLTHYGINWDEPYHYRRAQAFLHFFLTGSKTYESLPKYPPLKGDSDHPNFRGGQENFEAVQKNPSLSNPSFRRSFYQDDSWNGEFFIDEEHTYGHPSLNGLIAATFNKIFYQKLDLLGDLESYRLFIISIVSAAFLVVALFIWKEFGIIESLFTSLTLATYPLILGEQHFNIKDPVETAFYTLTIIFAYLGITRKRMLFLLLSAITFSLGLSTKFNIVFSIIPLSLWLIYYLLINKKKVNTKHIIIAFSITPILAGAALLLSYPTLWKNPLAGVEQIIKFYLDAGYPKSTAPGYFIGFFNAYPIVWIIYSTPPATIFLFIASLIFIKKLIKKNSFVLLLALWIAITIGRNSFFGALSYGGVRLIMEYIPAMAILAGISAGYLIKLQNSRLRSCIVALIILLALIPTIVKLVQIHPNENVYFNFLAGGLSGAKEKAIPSWGNSYGNAYFPGVLWLNDHAEENARVSTPIGNTSNIPRFKLRPDIAVSPYFWSGLEHKGEYLVELTHDYPPNNWFALKYLNTAMVPVYEVKVDGVAIAKVWKNDPTRVKAEFKKTATIQVKVLPDIQSQTLKIEMPTAQKVMQIHMTQPTTSCKPLQTGYVESSVDSKNWTREPEDIAVDQLNRHELKELKEVYNYYFFAREAKFFSFHLDSTDSCLLKANRAIITFVQ